MKNIETLTLNLIDTADDSAEGASSSSCSYILFLSGCVNVYLCTQQQGTTTEELLTNRFQFEAKKGEQKHKYTSSVGNFLHELVKVL